MSRICDNCAQELPDNAVVCSLCGKNLINSFNNSPVRPITSEVPASPPQALPAMPYGGIPKPAPRKNTAVITAVVLTLVALMVGGLFAAFKIFSAGKKNELPKDISAALVGAWELSDTNMPGIESDKMEFYSDGSGLMALGEYKENFSWHINENDEIVVFQSDGVFTSTTPYTILELTNSTLTLEGDTVFGYCKATYIRSGASGGPQSKADPLPSDPLPSDPLPSDPLPSDPLPKPLPPGPVSVSLSGMDYFSESIVSRSFPYNYGKWDIREQARINSGDYFDSFVGLYQKSTGILGAKGYSVMGTIEYLTNQEYTELSGILCLDFEYRSTERIGKIKIWGDGNILYTSDEIKGGFIPVPFTVDITDVIVLKIGFEYMENHNDSSLIGIADAKVLK